MTDIATNGVSFDPARLYSPFRTTQSPIPGYVRSEQPLTQTDFENSSEIREEYTRFTSDRNIQASLTIAGSLRSTYLTPGISSLLSNPPFDIFSSNLDGNLTVNALVATQLYTNASALRTQKTTYNFVVPTGIPASTPGISPYNSDLKSQYSDYTPNRFSPRNMVNVAV